MVVVSVKVLVLVLMAMAMVLVVMALRRMWQLVWGRGQVTVASAVWLAREHHACPCHH